MVGSTDQRTAPIYMFLMYVEEARALRDTQEQGEHNTKVNISLNGKKTHNISTYQRQSVRFETFDAFSIVLVLVSKPSLKCVLQARPS